MLLPLIILILLGVKSESGRHGAGLALSLFFFTLALDILDGVRGLPVSLLLKVLIQSVDYVGVDVVDRECVPAAASFPSLGVEANSSSSPRLRET